MHTWERNLNLREAGVRTYFLGFGGGNIDTLLEDKEHSIRKEILEFPPDIVVLQIGGNDIDNKPFDMHVYQFKAQESKRNISVSHPVDEPITEDHNYVHANTYPVFSDSDLELGASCTIDPSLNNDWKTGRRVVELQALAQQMFCTSCDARLHLADIESERRYGLGSILFIRCQNSVCSLLNDVKTGKRNNGTFDINSKLALVAMVHTGMGPVQINNLLATLNLPPVVPSTLKRREQKIDTTLETEAKQSCLEAQKEEIKKGNGKIHFFKAVGKHSIGDSVRKVCLRIAGNNQWSTFSLKKSLLSEVLHKVIISK
ncbi:unnamed protein product [Mytilus edulis]|uniref:Mutator-like transposase domain-containing protein n=1 Tax=Mytilus edulis TaxID=6550 RepID=A0A8S3SHM8_MYTED|nr:unnamed protein product [Mytilus edulis]